MFKLMVFGLFIIAVICLPALTVDAITPYPEIKNKALEDSLAGDRSILTTYKSGSVRKYHFMDSISFNRKVLGLSINCPDNDLKRLDLFKEKNPSDWNRSNAHVLGIQSDDVYLRKIEWHGVLNNVASSYVRQKNFQSIVHNYRNLLFYGFADMANGLMDNSLSQNDDITPSYFGLFCRSVTDWVDLDSDFGHLMLDPSLGFGSTGIKISYKFLYGTISSSWNVDKNKVSLKIRIPINSTVGSFSLPDKYNYISTGKDKNKPKN